MLPLTKREGAGAPAPPPRFDPVPGAVVDGKYRVDRTIGEGGMGIVVAATHLALDQPVAIKFLLPEAMRNKVAVERFLREARVAAMIRNEHVARVQDVGTLEGGIPYIVMEYLVGRDLGRIIAEDGALPIDDACEIALQACEALGEVHAAGIVHRDLKPSNLFVTRRSDGSPAVKLLDFGISKLTLVDDGVVDPALTATATIMGSPSYMSPEQLKSTKEVDPRADVWSLGAVLYEAVTGKPAFRGETVPQVCAMIASEDPRLPSTLREEIPIDLERAILRCLDKDAGRRIALGDLAPVLARFAPERAKASLERIEAVLGPAARAERPDVSASLPVLPLATAERSRTLSAWGRRQRRGRRPSKSAMVLLATAVAGALGVGLFTGRIDLPQLQGDIAGATSLVSSAATAVSSAVASAMGPQKAREGIEPSGTAAPSRAGAPLPSLPGPALPAAPSFAPLPGSPLPALPSPGASAFAPAPSSSSAPAASSVAAVPAPPLPSAAGSAAAAEEREDSDEDEAEDAEAPAAPAAAARPRGTAAPAHERPKPHPKTHHSGKHHHHG